MDALLSVVKKNGVVDPELKHSGKFYPFSSEGSAAVLTMKNIT